MAGVVAETDAEVIGDTFDTAHRDEKS